MRFWSREVSGWFLIGVGLYTFFTCYQFLLRGRIWEAAPLTIIGIFLFRGGIHLLKIEVDAVNQLLLARHPDSPQHRAGHLAELIFDQIEP